MLKCEIATWSFGDCDMEFRGLRHGVSLRHECQDISSQELLKSRNVERDYCESRRLEGKNIEISSVVRLGKEGIRL
jgi:hypothetical protein